MWGAPDATNDEAHLRCDCWTSHIWLYDSYDSYDHTVKSEVLNLFKLKILEEDL
jgi:hypothetical protein